MHQINKNALILISNDSYFKQSDVKGSSPTPFSLIPALFTLFPALFNAG
jgi:hypothetical protein